jgi:YegS/Rv2252/BmrU family lipid kinase
MNKAQPAIKYIFEEALMKPFTVMFIVNPKAGLQSKKRIEESLKNYLNHRKFQYEIQYTDYPGHATHLVAQAHSQGFNGIVAVGGDGSVNEIASAILHTGMTLGILPAGSGNGLAMFLGYGRNLNTAISKLNTATVQLIDCGRLNGQTFVNMAGIGFDGIVSLHMRKSPLRGFIAYFLQTLKAGLTYQAQTVRIQLDDQTIEEKCFAITVANGPMYGYNMSIAPSAQVDDGFFEVVILKDVPRWQYFAAIPATMNGKIYDATFVSHYHSRKVRIETGGTHYVHLDGEGLELQGPLEFDILPKILPILIPSKQATVS